LKTSVLVRAVPFWFFFLIPWSPSWWCFQLL
jgi:hypothetical protein